MSRLTAGTLLLIPALSLSLVACSSGNPPCQKLPPPSEAETAATREGAEVEREVTYQSLGSEEEAECVVVIDRNNKAVWEDQTDDA